jgi:hypothetical protein
MVEEHLSPEDVTEYWAPDAGTADVERIEAHVFACADCAQRLGAARAAIDGISDTVGRGRFQAIVTDAVLNRLARGGVRMRTFAVQPGTVVPCAVWAGDEVIVTRMRADFTGTDRVSIVMEVGGEEVDRLTDVPVRPGPGELIEAFSAEQLRQLGRAEVRLRVFGSRAPADEALVAEYILEHGGTIERRDQVP